MAFNVKGLTKLANLVPLADDVPTPGFFLYQSTADNLAAVVTAGYFNDVRDQLFNGALILAVASDAFRVLVVTAPKTGNVTVAARLGAVS